MPRVSGRQVYRDNLQPETASQYYQLSIFLSYIDGISSSLQERFNDNLFFRVAFCLRVTIFSLRKRRTGCLKVTTSADVQFSAPKSSEEQNKGHYVCRCPIFRPKLPAVVQIFCPKSSEEQKKVITSAGRSFSSNIPKFLCRHAV